MTKNILLPEMFHKYKLKYPSSIYVHYLKDGMDLMDASEEEQGIY